MRAVSFDCAGTLVDARWDPRKLIVDAALAMGLEVKASAGDSYAGLYLRRLSAFHEANIESEAAVRKFWLELDREWLVSLGIEGAKAEELDSVGREMLFGPGSKVFTPFADSEPTLRRVKTAGIRMIIVSNWDRSLHTVLDMLGWTDMFEVVVASLEFGIEKPDPRIFEHALSRLGLNAAEVLHVGDNPIDDLQGAAAVGMPAALIDRSRSESTRPYIHTLDMVETALAWND
jgi:putative hydrolase of the HAD superfamily